LEESSDEALMEQFMAGDARAFEGLFTRYAGAVKTFLIRACGNPSAAEDLTQVTFLSLVRARERFRPGARVKPWLYAIALNAARDWRRQRRDALTEKGSLPAEVAVETGPAVDPGLEKAVRRALQGLPDKLREAIVLHRFEGLSFGEISEVLGISPVAVRVRAHRGYEQLRLSLRSVWEEA
jgi:RNA polymerase sigma-70 factor (ECF subfamily)